MSDLLPQICTLRSAIQANGRLNLEFKANLSQLLRTHGVEVSDDVLAGLVVALPDEIATASTILPVPDLGPIAQ